MAAQRRIRGLSELGGVRVCLDLNEPGVIKGLCVDERRPLELLDVELLLDGTRFASQLAVGIVDYRSYIDVVSDFSDYRGRLGGVRSVPGHFRFELSPYIPRDREVRLTLRVNGRDTVDRTVTLGEGAEAALSARMGRRLIGGLGVSGLSDDTVQVTGLVSLPQGVEPMLLIDGVPSPCQFESTAFQMGVPSLFAGREVYSVRATASLAPGEHLVWLAGQGGADLQIPASSAIAFPPDWREMAKRWRYPEDHQVQRVAAHSSGPAYFFSGWQTAVALTALFADHAKGPVTDVLDWGCGCGRVSQHLLETSGLRLTGIDIDPENVAWCHANLTAGRFLAAPLMPPVAAPDAAFDAAFAISVLTHLTEEAADAWVGEMARLLRPDGLLIVTVSSFDALLRHNAAHFAYEQLMTRGIDDTVVGVTLDGVLSAQEQVYYRETFHSHDYLRRRWADLFDIVAIYPALHFNLQDYVVFRRRRDRRPVLRELRLVQA